MVAGIAFASVWAGLLVGLRDGVAWGWALLPPALGAAWCAWLLHRRHGARLGEAERAVLVSRVPLYRRLDPARRARFEALAAQFLAAVRIESVRGAVVNARRRAFVAASAAGLQLGGARFRLPASVLVYPTAFDWDLTIGAGGELAGMVHDRDTVLIAGDALDDAFGRIPSPTHVGYHEFAHLLDPDLRLDGETDRRPHRWERAWRHETRRMFRRRADLAPALDAYAAQDPTEFFAVAVETFLHRPRRLRRRHPALYRRLAATLRFDPLTLHGVPPAGT